jgi:tetratricopeptide (TPR) repeat protein
MADDRQPVDPSKDPNMIRVFDAYGREMFITKETWRETILPGKLKEVWDDPQHLYTVIVQSLDDGFVADMLEPAEHLAAVDSVAERGAIVLAVVYRRLKRLDDSERVLQRHVERHGESGVVLGNLAKIHADRGLSDLSVRTLWRALELDPNQENGFGWYVAIHRDKDGEPAAVEAMRRVAALPGSWRARLWLARDALARRQPDEALALYREALAMVGRPVPTDLLQQASGDLGQAGRLQELLDLTTPHFDAAVHGIAVGNNLVKANLDLGRLDAVRALLDQLHAQNRPDWKQNLSFWDNKLAEARTALANAAPVPDRLSVTMLVVDDPVWLPAGTAAGELFPAPAEGLAHVAFLGGTAEVPSPGKKPAHRLSDAPGRLSRALPLFLAEQIHFGARARVHAIVPWLQGDNPCFVLGGVPWKDEDAAQYGRRGDTPCSLVVVTHFRSAAEPWRVELRLIRTGDAACLGNAAAEFSKERPEPALLGLADDLFRLLAQQAGLALASPPPQYRVPKGNDFAYYLLCLEQLLAVRCGTMPGVPAGFLSNERDIIDGSIQLCLAQSENAVPRVLLAEILRRMRKVFPAVVTEFRRKVLLLQKEKPLPRPAQDVLERLFLQVYP